MPLRLIYIKELVVPGTYYVGMFTSVTSHWVLLVPFLAYNIGNDAMGKDL